MVAAAKLAISQATDFGGGGGDGPFGPKDVAIYILEQQNAELREVMRQLLDSDGPEAVDAFAKAHKLLDSHDTIEREDRGAAETERHFNSPACDCGTYKGVGTPYCPECDKEAMERLGLAVPVPLAND